MTEIWKSVVGYEGIYEVSNLGNVRNVNWRGLGYRNLALARDKDGYLMVTLCNNGIQRVARVHRMVANAFIENPYNKPQVNHKDENKTNNKIDNLEWVNSFENNNHGTRNARISKSKLNTNCKSVLQLEKNGELLKEWVSISEVCRQFGYDTGLISRCCMGKKKSAYGYLWKYANATTEENE